MEKYVIGLDFGTDSVRALLALYYFMDKETGHERYIGATIRDPPARGKE